MGHALADAITVLDGAGAVLREHGWQQGGSAGDARWVSLEGALGLAARGRACPTCHFADAAGRVSLGELNLTECPPWGSCLAQGLLG